MNIAVLLAALGAAAPAADPPTRPAGPPPQLVKVKYDKDGTLTVQQHTMVYRQQEEIVNVTVGGKGVPERRGGSVVEAVPITSKMVAKDVKALGLDGLPIDAAKLPKLLDKETMVLFSYDGRPVDSFYTQFFKEGTLILVPPARTMPVGAPVPDLD